MVAKITARRRSGSPAVAALCLGLWACQLALPAPAQDPAVDVPERQFTLQDTQIEERRHQRIFWTGHARRASGDRQHMDAEQIDLMRLPEDPSQAPLCVEARNGVLALAQDRAHFWEAVVRHPVGELHAPEAVYLGNLGRLDGSGPLHILHGSGRTAATAGRLYVERGCLELDGPVTGRLSPPAPAPRRP